jgi:hypothetical protein
MQLFHLAYERFVSVQWRSQQDYGDDHDRLRLDCQKQCHMDYHHGGRERQRRWNRQLQRGGQHGYDFKNGDDHRRG